MAFSSCCSPSSALPSLPESRHSGFSRTSRGFFFRTQHFRWDEVEDFRLGRVMNGLPFGWVIHALLRNEEVVTLDVAAYSWSLTFGARAKREQILNRLREWLPSRN
jgi:hypothetical protein